MHTQSNTDSKRKNKSAPISHLLDIKEYHTLIVEIFWGKNIHLSLFFQDVIELLEKRVKSRFSHRQLHLLPSWTQQEYNTVAHNYISLPKDFIDPKYAKQWNAQLKVHIFSHFTHFQLLFFFIRNKHLWFPSLHIKKSERVPLVL